MTGRAVCNPELPEAARPQWPPWYTGSLLAVIAIHTAFNTFAMLSVVPLPAILIGLLVISSCLLAPRWAGRWPSPLPA